MNIGITENGKKTKTGQWFCKPAHLFHEDDTLNFENSEQ